MTLNDHFTLNSVLRRYVYNSEAWLSDLGYSSTCSEGWHTLQESLANAKVRMGLRYSENCVILTSTVFD